MFGDYYVFVMTNFKWCLLHNNLKSKLEVLKYIQDPSLLHSDFIVDVNGSDH